MNDSHITVDAQGRPTSFIGRDATMLFRARLLKSSIELYVNSGGRIIPTRGVTITKMLAMASDYTGKKYKRGQATQAAADLQVWCATMTAALPIIRD